jgi:deazaflavin-dependent oxidoreductase (nitroreductase family)
VVFASNSGSDKEPDWLRNVKAHPMATVEVRHKMFEATVTIETGEFRDELFAEHCHDFPVFADEQAKTTRRIPAVSLRMAGRRPR